MYSGHGVVGGAHLGEIPLKPGEDREIGTTRRPCVDHDPGEPVERAFDTLDGDRFRLAGAAGHGQMISRPWSSNTGGADASTAVCGGSGSMSIGGYQG